MDGSIPVYFVMNQSSLPEYIMCKQVIEQGLFED